MIKDTALSEYADLLAANGFAIYEPRSSHGDYFKYSRVVDGGRECFGYVQHEYFGGYSHSMPIRPSRENGSSMYIDGVAGELTLEAARKVARPFNRNELVGRQENYRDELRLDRLYIKR